jgi:hypothetical protein
MYSAESTKNNKNNKEVAKMATKKYFKGLKYINKGKKDGISIFPYLAGQYWNDDTEEYVTINMDDSNVGKTLKGKATTYHVNTGDGKYDISFGITLLIPKDSKDSKELIKTIKEVAEQNKLKKGWTNPLKDGDEKIAENYNEDKDLSIYEGMYYMKFETKIKNSLKIFDKYKNLLHKNWTMDDDGQYNGYYSRLSSMIKPYKAGSNIGIKGYLQGVQFLDQSPLEIGGGNIEDDFDFEEEPTPMEQTEQMTEEDREIEDAM